MPLSEIILIIMGLLTVAMLAAGICRNIPIPFTVFLVILGVLFGWSARTWEQFEPLLEFQLTPELVLFLFLPALIFESAFNLDARKLLKDLPPVMILAIPALLISTFVIGFGLWLLLDMSFILALLFGSLISATDPVAVVALFKELGAPQRLTVLVEGESLLNDATAIVIFNIILALALGNTVLDASGLGLAVVEFFRVFVGGIVLGCIFGLLMCEVLFRLRASIGVYLIMSIVLAYASFTIAEHELHISGVMTVVAAAISMAAYGVSRIPQEATHFVKESWEVISLVCNSLLFLLVGLSVDVVQIASHLDSILIAVLLVLIARASTIYTIVPATIHTFRLPRVTIAERHIMWWGGLKGGLAIAIVLSIPADLPGRDLILNMTLGAVLFSLLVNAPTIRPLMHKLGIDRLTNDEQAELKHALTNAEKHAHSILNKLRSTDLVSSSTQQLIEKKTAQVFASSSAQIPKEQDVRHLYITALRIELDELKHLYDIGLIQHYAYLDIKSILQRDRDSWFTDTKKYQIDQEQSKKSIFLQIENSLIRRFREHDWAAGILARYQYLRLSQRLQRYIAGVLISRAVLDMLELMHDEFDQKLIQQAHEVYNRRLDQNKQRIDNIVTEFPDFYLRYETRLLAKVSLIAANHYAEQAEQNGEIGVKIYSNIDRRVRDAIANLPAISNPALKLTISDLIGTVPLLKSLSEKVLEDLAKRAKAVTFLVDDVVIGEGERGNALYIIYKGQVNVYKNNNNEPIAKLYPGDFFGEMALFGDQKRTATVKAKIPSVLLRLRRKDVLELAEGDPELKIRLEEAKSSRQ